MQGYLNFSIFIFFFLDRGEGESMEVEVGACDFIWFYFATVFLFPAFFRNFLKPPLIFHIREYTTSALFIDWGYILSPCYNRMGCFAAAISVFNRLLHKYDQ